MEIINKEKIIYFNNIIKFNINIPNIIVIYSICPNIYINIIYLL